MLVIIRKYFYRISAIALFFLVLSCSINKFFNNKIEKPQFNGVPTEIRPILNEFIYLANKKGIYFNNTVTIGFKNLSDQIAAGQCHYGEDFREITIAPSLWPHYDELSKKILLFHELIHCYCDRAHDYGEESFYNANRDQIKQELDKARHTYIPGYFSDGCPVTLMHPFVLNNICAKRYYQYYINEMFSRCEPYNE